VSVCPEKVSETVLTSAIHASASLLELEVVLGIVRAEARYVEPFPLFSGAA
jgi:hypothetical protein